MLRTVVVSSLGEEPGGPPIKVTCGRPPMTQADLEVFTRPTGLKLEPAVPLPLSGVRVSWPDTQAVGTTGRVEVVVLVEVLDVDVDGATVVEVEVEVDDDAGTVVVAGVAALEQPPTSATNPSVMRSRLATAGLERRNVSPGFDGGSVDMGHRTPSMAGSGSPSASIPRRLTQTSAFARVVPPKAGQCRGQCDGADDAQRASRHDRRLQPCPSLNKARLDVA